MQSLSVFGQGGYECFQSCPVLVGQCKLECLLETFFIERVLPAGEPGAQVGPTPRLLAGGVHQDMPAWCAHDPQQFAFRLVLFASDTGTHGNVPGSLDLLLRGFSHESFPLIVVVALSTVPVAALIALIVRASRTVAIAAIATITALVAVLRSIAAISSPAVCSGWLASLFDWFVVDLAFDGFGHINAPATHFVCQAGVRPALADSQRQLTLRYCHQRGVVGIAQLHFERLDRAERVGDEGGRVGTPLGDGDFFVGEFITDV